MISKGAAMEESISICKDYNIDIDTAMDLVLESSLYDYDDEIATESLLGKSMRFGPRFLSGIKRLCSFIANAIRAIIAKLTKKDKTREVKLEKIGNSVGSYILKSAEMISSDVAKLAETCGKNVKDIAKTIKPAYDAVKSSSNASMNLSFTINHNPEDLKYKAGNINTRFTYLKDYCTKMEDKYSSDKTKINFVAASIADLIKKDNANKIVDKLNSLNNDLEELRDKSNNIVGICSNYNNARNPSQTKEEKEQQKFVCQWSNTAYSYIKTTATTVSIINEIMCSKALHVPAVFFNSKP